jgi:deoxyribose-phosphate aldolase
MEEFIAQLEGHVPKVRELMSHLSGDEVLPMGGPIATFSPDTLGTLIDHTNLKPEATHDDLNVLIDEAVEIKAASVCVHSINVKYVHDALQSRGTELKVCSVVGFPTGAVTSAVKAFETAAAVADGAEEIDMVIHIGGLKDKQYSKLYTDIEAVRMACPGLVLKVILETAALTDDEITFASWAAVLAGADYLKTSTGFGPGGATTKAVTLLRQVSPKVKASGGMKTREDCEAMLKAGATRLGLSRGYTIIKGNAASEGSY